MPSSFCREVSSPALVRVRMAMGLTLVAILVVLTEVGGALIETTMDRVFFVLPVGWRTTEVFAVLKSLYVEASSFLLSPVPPRRSRVRMARVLVLDSVWWVLRACSVVPLIMAEMVTLIRMNRTTVRRPRGLVTA